MVDIAKVHAANTARWNVAKIWPVLIPAIDEVVRQRLLPGKARYIGIQNITGVPWYFLSVVAERESSSNWACSLAQGDRWNQRSVHQPVGRGPFRSWEDAAVDALVNCGPYAARNKDWSIGTLLTMLEMYNGLGYAMNGMPSPYVWCSTDQYERGKYTSDGVLNRYVVDAQMGCAAMLLRMSVLDPSIGLRNDLHEDVMAVLQKGAADHPYACTSQAATG